MADPFIPPYLMPFVVLDFFLSLVLLLPISDSRKQQRFPIVTLILVGLNTGIFIYTDYVLPRQIGDEGAFLFLRRQMLMPQAVVNGIGLPGWNMISAAFLHGSWSHLLGNMFFLMFFGRKVEDLLGPAKFLLLYLACIYLSHLASVIGEMALPVWQGTIPSLGASGAIMGVVGAYLFLYYEERIRTLPIIWFEIPIPFVFYMPRFPVWVFILYTIIKDVLNGWLEEQFQAIGSYYSFTNSFAHLGGIIGGMLCIYLFLPASMLHFRRGRPGPLRVNKDAS
jgi:membrane associated rhomboid family serine protease